MQTRSFSPFTDTVAKRLALITRTYRTLLATARPSLWLDARTPVVLLSDYLLLSCRSGELAMPFCEKASSTGDAFTDTDIQTLAQRAATSH